MRGRIVLVLGLMALSGCSDSPSAPEPDPTVSGAWSGSSIGVSLDLTLNEGANGSVSGSGSIAGDISVSLSVSQGTHVFPYLSLVLSAPQFENVTLAGMVSSDGASIAATLDGSGFNDFDLNLRKQ